MTLNPEERKQKLGRFAATTLRERTGRSLGHIYEVLAGRRRDRTVEVAAARMLSLTVEEAFPPFPAHRLDPRARRKAIA